MLLLVRCIYKYGFMGVIMKTIIMTFFLVFLAELGDKTQLATMLMAAKSDSVWTVFLGSTIALAASSLIGVLAGGIITKYVPQSYIHYASGIAFIIIGILLVSGKI
jgi:putative Ca2+/H+ antiporter (TMEM165/GDT1 family)